MNNEEVKSLLLYLIDKYIDKEDLKDRLVYLTLNKKDFVGRPPVKGIMYDILSNMKCKLEEDDDIKIDKLRAEFS